MAFKMAASRKKLNADTHRWLTYIKWFSCMCLMITGSLGATLTRLVSKYGRKEVSSKGPDFRGQRLGPQASTNRGPSTKPFIFYFSLMIVAYETTQIAKSDIISSRKWQNTVLTH